MTRKRNLRLLSLALCIAMLFQCFLCHSFAEQDSASANNNSISVLEDSFLDNTSYADDSIIQAANDNTDGKVHVRRLTDEENLNTMVFANADGTKTAYYFNEPIKYVDEDGNVKDISLDIQENANNKGAFTSKEGRTRSDFSKSLSEGVYLDGNGVSLRLVPRINTTARVSGFPQAELKDNKKVVYNTDSKTSYEYTLTYSGFKEDIVVSEYTGQTEYLFTLYTNGLRLESDSEGDMYLYDEYGSKKASIGRVIVFTADEQNNAFGNMSFDVVKENQEYILKIQLDSEYLADDKTIYPIRIDPEYKVLFDDELSVNIADVTINSADSLSGTSSTISAGKYGDDNSVSRILMKFPNLDTSNMVYVENATVYIRDLMCQHEYMTLECYLFTGEVWSESNATWTNVSLNSNSDELLDSQEISYFVGKEFDRAHYYGFDITEAILEWKDIKYYDVEHTIIYSNEKGIIFKASDECESGTTHNYKTFGSFNRTTYQPYLTVTFSAEEMQAYNFVSTATGALLTSDVYSGAVVMSSSNDEASQWQIIQDESGYYTIVNFDLRILGENASQEQPYLEEIGNVLYCTGTQQRVASFDEAMTSNDDKWTIDIFYENGEVLCTIQSYTGYYLSASSNGTVMLSSVNDSSKWKLVPCSNKHFASSSDMEQYIEKINNSGLVLQMNCYAYAMGLYHYYEPEMVCQGNPYYTFWYIGKLQMGVASNSTRYTQAQEDFYDDIDGSSPTFAEYKSGQLYINSQGKEFLVNAILDATDIDINNKYGISDGIQESSLSEKLYGGWKKVALVMSTNLSVDGYDYHWYLQHADGTWSHKPGINPVTTLDDSGNIILDPATANRGMYDYFVGYYKIYSESGLKEAFPSAGIDTAGDCLAHAQNIGTVNTSISVSGKIEYGTFHKQWKGNYTENDIWYLYWYEWNYNFTSVDRYLYIDGNKNVSSKTTYTVSTIEEFINTERNALYITTSMLLSEDDGIAALNASSLPGDIDFYEFTAGCDGIYAIYTEVSDGVPLDTYGVLYDGYNIICANDELEGFSGYNFFMYVQLEAGNNYRISVRSYNFAYGGNYTLNIVLQNQGG